ncbi:MAG TPA: MFS transporter [Micromonosporaceae bacterium]|nr:MFS transporter [Micromonosporaceae bacterium]
MDAPRATGLGPRFARFWAASTISFLGDGVTVVAAALLVASRTSDPLLVSGAVFAATLPWLLFSLLSGGLVDRLDRRRVMVTVDWVRAAAIAGLGVAVLVDAAPLALIYAVMFLLGTGETLFRAASQSILPALVRPEQLERANGRLAGARTLVHDMVAAPLGGLLFAVAAAAPFLLDAASFAVGAVLLGLLRGRFHPRPGGAGETGAGTSLRSEIGVGVRWLLAHRLLRTLAVLIGLLNVTLTGALAILVLVATQRLGLGSVGYGLLFTAMAVGGLVGALCGEWLIRRFTASVTVRVGLLVETAFHLVMAVSTSPAVVGAALAVFGVHGALWTMVTTSLRQRLTPPAMLGRVNSAYLFIAAGGNALGALLGGLVASRFGLTAPYWIGFVLAAAVTAVTWREFDRRTMAAAYAGPAAEAG